MNCVILIYHNCNCRAHSAFLEDVLDGSIISAGCSYWGIDSPDQQPTLNKPPPIVYRLLSPDEQLKWALEVASNVRVNLCSSDVIRQHVEYLRTNMTAHQQADEWCECNKREGWYQCPACRNRYKTRNGFIKHVSSSHQTLQSRCVVPNAHRLSPPIPDRQSLLHLLLLIRDLSDAHAMGDGDRIFRDLKLAFMYFFTTGHTKYRLWIWRMLAYDIAILTPRRAFEYRWNTCVNVNGGIHANIPDDNLVELNVRQLKELLRNQGSNVSYESARIACLSMKFMDAVKLNLKKSCGLTKVIGRRGECDKMTDVLLIAKELMLCETNGQSTFIDPLLRINAEALHTWISGQKITASTLLVHK